MKYEKDKITVIIPVYNVENYLEIYIDWSNQKRLCRDCM